VGRNCAMFVTAYMLGGRATPRRRGGHEFGTLDAPPRAADFPDSASVARVVRRRGLRPQPNELIEQRHGSPNCGTDTATAASSLPPTTLIAAGRRRGRNEFLGFRNRNFKQKVFGDQTRPSRTKVGRIQSGQVTRWLTLLRAHHLIKKVSQTHRHLLTEKGRLIITSMSLLAWVALLSMCSSVNDDFSSQDQALVPDVPEHQEQPVVARATEQQVRLFIVKDTHASDQLERAAHAGNTTL